MERYDDSYVPETNPYEEPYFEWMVSKIGNVDDPFASKVTYNKLLNHLHYNSEFTYCMPQDENIELNGINLRDVFCYECDYDKDTVVPALSRPCTLLEAMVALAIKMEKSMAADTDFGDRTGQWFWTMIKNMHLGGFDDESFDPDYADVYINRCLERNYKPDGDGGFFKIEGIDNRGEDMRDVEIWMQVCWYMDTVLF